MSSSGKDDKKKVQAGGARRAQGKKASAAQKRPAASTAAPAGFADIREAPAERARRAREIARILAAQYPDARCMLDYQNPYQLLIATILAAQCTDERVNMVTPALFRRYPDPEKMAGASIEELEALVRSTGFFHSKAKSIQGASEAIARRFKGELPRTMEGFLELPGVGRKTANVVLGNCYGVPSIVVDTHVRRVVQRLGLADTDNPDAIEEQLQPLIQRDEWTAFSHAVTFHGRRCCMAKKPNCPGCPVERLCPWTLKTVR
jgi:endonuclease-3